MNDSPSSEDRTCVFCGYPNLNHPRMGCDAVPTPAVAPSKKMSLVKRLRDLVAGDDKKWEAEIERLTAYIKQWAEDDAERDAQFQELERVLESLQNKWASRPIDHPNGEALGKENERLHAALERIASAGEIHDPHWAGKVAREALAPQTGDKHEN